MPPRVAGWLPRLRSMDAGQHGFLGPLRGQAAAEHVRRAGGVELAVGIGLGEEHDRLDDQRRPILQVTQGRRAAEQRHDAMAVAAGGRERVVERTLAAVGAGPAPAGVVAGDDARVRLQLDEDTPTRVTTNRSTSLMVPSSPTNSTLAQAR